MQTEKTQDCSRCGAQPMEDQTGVDNDWCGCDSESCTEHLLHWTNPETMKCEHPDHDDA